jgi:hypothetical protein
VTMCFLTNRSLLQEDVPTFVAHQWRLDEHRGCAQLNHYAPWATRRR